MKINHLRYIFITTDLQTVKYYSTIHCYYSEIKDWNYPPSMLNKSALSMVSNLLQDNTLYLNCNLWNQIPMFIINMHLVVQFCTLGLCPLLS